jgi:starch-binding outer membrane protein, SusD/RagB family
MRIKNIAGLLSAIMLLSCSEDFLDRPPMDAIVDATYYQNDEQVMSGTAALYSVAWKEYCDQANWKVGDVRAGVLYSPWATSSDIRDFTTFNVTGLSAANINTWRSCYNVIGMANTIVKNINQYAGDAVTESVKKYAIAEARFMRATAYAYLVQNYGPVPLIEDNTLYLDNPALKRHEVQSVWQFIERDYLFAVENMPDESPQPGRLNKWSAEGMLARTYLTMAGISGTIDEALLDKAQEYADRVITMSGRTLLTEYAELFRYPYDNKNESLFELQWVYTTIPFSAGGYSYPNTMISQITPHNSISANSDGWGGGLGATNWMLSQYEGLYNGYNGEETAAPGFTLDERLKETFMLPGFKYPELATENDAFLSAGDKAMLFLANNGNATPGDGMNFASIKKYVIGKIVGESDKQNYPNNTYMLRLAELYLIYAEAQVLKDGGQTSDAKAVEYFNEVHTRAGLAEFADPLDWDVIFSERVKEFAMEGLAWYDLTRRHYYDAAHVYEILNAQQRGQFLVVPEPWPNPTGWSFYKTLWDTESDRIPASGDNFMMPIPQVELSQAPSLSEEPVPYNF